MEFQEFTTTIIQNSACIDIFSSAHFFIDGINSPSESFYSLVQVAYLKDKCEICTTQNFHEPVVSKDCDTGLITVPLNCFKILEFKQRKYEMKASHCDLPMNGHHLSSSDAAQEILEPHNSQLSANTLNKIKFEISLQEIETPHELRQAPLTPYSQSSLSTAHSKHSLKPYARNAADGAPLNIECWAIGFIDHEQQGPANQSNQEGLTGTHYQFLDLCIRIFESTTPTQRLLAAQLLISYLL